MSKKKPAAATPPESASAQIERQLVVAALEKKRLGEVPSSQERAALKRFEKQKDAELRWHHYRNVPKKDYREMTGRQARVINDQADRYDMPIAGPVVDIAALAKWIHDSIAKGTIRFGGSKSDDPLLVGSNSPALEQYRQERTLLARLERFQKEEELLPREDVHDGLARFAQPLRQAGETLLKQFGPEAHAILMEALDDCAREIESMFGGTARGKQRNQRGDPGGAAVVPRRRPRAKDPDDPPVR